MTDEWKFSELFVRTFQTLKKGSEISRGESSKIRPTLFSGSEKTKIEGDFSFIMLKTLFFPVLLTTNLSRRGWMFNFSSLLLGASKMRAFLYWHLTHRVFEWEVLLKSWLSHPLSEAFLRGPFFSPRPISVMLAALQFYIINNSNQRWKMLRFIYLKKRGK